MTFCRLAVLAVLGAACALTGCDQLLEKQSKDAIEQAQKKSSAGDFRAAIKLYEGALDGTARTADVHYKLAVLYDEKLKSPLNAMHHFERYLEVAPKGTYAKEAKAYRKEGELKLMASMSKGTLVSQDEAVRLKNENLSLRKQLVALRLQKNVGPPSTPSAKEGEATRKPIPPGAKTHTVQAGETLAVIAQKHYKNKARWKDIQDANFYQLEGTVKIVPGQTLIIP